MIMQSQSTITPQLLVRDHERSSSGGGGDTPEEDDDDDVCIEMR